MTQVYQQPTREVFPDVEILTARLRLRPYTEDDVAGHLAIFDHDLARQWSIAPQPYTWEHAKEWCTHLAPRVRTTGDGICWAGEDRESGRLVGMTGLHNTDWGDRISELSANAVREVHGRGHAREALAAISHWALTEQRFLRLRITAQLGNVPPQRVAESCGFVRQGVVRQAGTDRAGNRVDMVLYTLTRDHLRGLPQPEYSVRPARARADETRPLPSGAVSAHHDHTEDHREMERA